MVISIFPVIQSIFLGIKPLFAPKQLTFNDDSQGNNDRGRNSSQDSQSSQSTNSQPNAQRSDSSNRNGVYSRYQN